MSLPFPTPVPDAINSSSRGANIWRLQTEFWISFASSLPQNVNDPAATSSPQWTQITQLDLVPKLYGYASIKSNCSHPPCCNSYTVELATTSLEFEFHLHFPCGSLWTELSDFRQSARSRNEHASYVNKHWKTHAKVASPQTSAGRLTLRVMMSLLISSPPISILHQLFRCRY